MSKITTERKATYYIGTGLIVIGFILFMSTFFFIVGAMNDPVRAAHKPPPFINSVVGFILIVAGIVAKSVGANGPAGSGLLLDPEKAREDLKPFNEAKGEMLNDVISNIDAVDKFTKANVHMEIIKIKCRNCGCLNDEDAKFCKGCGMEI